MDTNNQLFSSGTNSLRATGPKLQIAGILLIGTIIILSLLSVSLKAEPVRIGHVQAELISEVSSIQPGQPFWVGLHLQMDEHWHVYWRNPGDAGIPPEIKWDLPEGFTVGEIQWPYPERIITPPLVGFGYSNEILLPIEITPPANLKIGQEITLKAHAGWLVCREKCIPGETDLNLTLPVIPEPSGINDEWAGLFNETRSRYPIELTDWAFDAEINKKNIKLLITVPEYWQASLDSVYFFPFDKDLISHAAPQSLTKTETGYILELQRAPFSLDVPDKIEGLLFSDNGWRGEGSEKALLVKINKEEEKPQQVAAVADDAPLSVWGALLFAFLGGLILNLMPCVLPVLSLKILGFVNQAGEDRRKVLMHGVIFTIGVVVSFWILTGGLLALRAGGEELGWGFQLQSPTFVLILASFMFLFGLNLLGVFEIGGSLTSAGGNLANKRGWGGSFLNGVTATVVATPCTAPFMGSALGFSLTQPVWVIWLIFTSLALGMAFPYLVLSAWPRLLRFLPKPGEWMNTLKQIMGFLLIATVIWLTWVLSIQGGTQAVMALLITLFLLGLGAWIYGRWGNLGVKASRRTAAYIISIILFISALGVGLAATSMASVKADASGVIRQGKLSWEAFEPEQVKELRRANKPILIDFTAAWCLSCQVNEKVAFGDDEVQDRLNQLGVVTMKADWTNRDEKITRALAEFGRNSVPLYVLYSADPSEDAIILPEIITPGIVLNALKKIEK